MLEDGHAGASSTPAAHNDAEDSPEATMDTTINTVRDLLSVENDAADEGSHVSLNPSGPLSPIGVQIESLDSDEEQPRKRHKKRKDQPERKAMPKRRK